MTPGINKLKSYMGFIIMLYIKLDSSSESIRDKMILINNKRLFYVSIIAMPLSFTEIVIFLLNSSTADQKDNAWKIGIIMAHSTILILMALFGCISFFLRKAKIPNLLMTVIQYIAIMAIMLAGTIIVSIDQLVVSSITPFVIVCTITGAVFMIRPMYATIIYIVSYLIFHYAISLTQLNQTLLLSNRVNGLFAAGIGICLSYILWRTNSVNIEQEDFIVRQQKELEEKNKQLEQLAFFDPLTGLFNRRYFEEQLKNEISRMIRYGNESCVAIMDIDYFKDVNDNFGHPAGDRMLIKIASILNKHLRETDILSRWGGEEFIILLPNTSLDTGKLVAEKMRIIIENELFIVEDHKIQITVSFGVALLMSDINDSFEQCYFNADKALYNAKQNGRNRVETV